MDPNLAKVGVEVSNPFARSNDFNALGDRTFVAESSIPSDWSSHPQTSVGLLCGLELGKAEVRSTHYAAMSCSPMFSPEFLPQPSALLS